MQTYIQFLKSVEIAEKKLALFWNTIAAHFEVRNEQNVICGIGDTETEAEKDAEVFVKETNGNC